MAKSKGKNFITLAIMGLLALSLVGFGVTEFGGSVRSVATVGKTEVDTNEYANAIQAQMRRLQQQTGQQMSFQQARQFGVDQFALGQLITDAAFEDEAANVGLSAGDEFVGERIQNSPAFNNASGEFDRAIYEATLRQSGLNSGDYETNIRSDIAESLLRSAIGSGVQSSEVYLDTLFNYARETRDVTWLRLGVDDLDAPIGEPSDADLATFHEANPYEFTRPETKTISYAWLTPDMLVDSVEVPEEQLQMLYDTRLEEFVQPERRLVERLVYSSEDQAIAAKERLDAAEVTFDALVEERGLELTDIDLGDVGQDDLGEAAADIFALTEPGVVGPLPSNLGPALFRMNGILAARETSFDDAREGLQLDAATDRARRIILDSVTQVEDLLAGGADMSILAERSDMEEGSIDWNVEVVDGIAAYAAFRNAAFAASQGDAPEVVELEDGGIFALSVDSIAEPALRPLNEVQEDVTAAWTRVETEKALTAKADTLTEKLRGGASFEDLELTPEESLEQGRVAFIEGTPPNFMTELFDMAGGDLRTLSADGDAWLLRLDQINAPDASTPEAETERTQFAAQAATEYSNGLSSAFAQALVERAGVEINQGALNAVHSHLP